MSSEFQGNGQGKKHIFECQRYSLLQARLNRRDADDKKNRELFSVTTK
jgi:hypothetical protein